MSAVEGEGEPETTASRETVGDAEHVGHTVLQGEGVKIVEAVPKEGDGSAVIER